MMNRRQLLQGTAAIAAMAALPPVPAKTQYELLDEKLLPRVEWEYMSNVSPNTVEVVKDITRKLIRMDLFRLDRIMDLPTQIVSNGHERTCAIAKTRMLRTTLTDFDNLDSDAVAREIANEIRKWYGNFGKIQVSYLPYVPVQSVRFIDVNTFLPRIGFKTRYDLMYGNWKSITMEQERQMTIDFLTRAREKGFVVPDLERKLGWRP